MSVDNEEAIQATDAVARAAAGAYIDATALVAAVASVHETKKTAEEARQNMLEASRAVEAFAQDVQQKVIAFDINAVECSTVMYASATAVLRASNTTASAAAYAANATCEYADACEAVEAAKECLAVAVARIRLTAATAANAAKAATPLVRHAADPA